MFAANRLSDDQLREIAELYQACGRNGLETARVMGVKRSTVRIRVKRAIERGFLLPEAGAEVPDGYRIKGTSTLYKTHDDGRTTKTIEWIKTDQDKERQRELAEEAVKVLCEDIPPRKKATPPKNCSSDLLAAYPVGDAHVGMLCWHEDAGGDYDLKIAESMLCGAIDHLIQATPKCKTAVIALLGDFLHYDSMRPETPQNKNKLDADSRAGRMVKVVMRIVEHLIQSALKRHEQVRLIVEIGNHDMYSSLWLQQSFDMAYRHEPRLTVDTSPASFHFLQHGKTLIGTHHGDRVKMAALPLIMATDLPEEWGASEHRYWWTGHIHHDRIMEFPGCKVESFRVIAPADAWSHSQGYRSGQDMKAIVYHKEHGEMARYTVNPGMLDEKGG